MRLFPSLVPTDFRSAASLNQIELLLEWRDRIWDKTDFSTQADGISAVFPHKCFSELVWGHKNVEFNVLAKKKQKTTSLEELLRTCSAATFLSITVSLLPRTTSLLFSLKMLSAEEIVLMIFFFWNK